MSLDRIVGVGLSVLLVCCSSSVEGLSPPLNVRRQRNRFTSCLHGSTTQDPSTTGTTPETPSLQKLESESNFWYSVTAKNDKTASEKIPCVPSLDADGPLPPGAYRLIGDPQNDPVRTCLVTVAVDLTRQGLNPVENDAFALDPNGIIRDVHEFIDSGLTTFQLKSDVLLTGNSDKTYSEFLQDWGEKNVFGQLRRDTPNSVLRDCHFVVPMDTPSADSISNRRLTRETVLDSLKRIGSDCIDTLQLKHCDGSPYHLDILDTLSDLQREGLVRSVSGINMPVELMRTAEDCGFHLDSNQFDCNLLDPTKYSRSVQKACSDLGGKLLLSSPLAGGLLSERHLHEIRHPPMSWELNPSEHKNMKTTLKRWAEKHPGGGGTAWQRYQRLVMGTLEEIAFKHEVSVASVSMRWALQLDHVGSIVPACSLGLDKDVRGRDIQSALREIFRFELDSNDMDRLWKVSGRKEEPPAFTDFDSFDVDDAELLPPEMNDRSLWL